MSDRFTLTTDTGQTYSFIGDSLTDFYVENDVPGSLKKTFSIPIGDGYEYISIYKVESIYVSPIPPAHSEWDNATIDYLYQKGLSSRPYKALRRRGLKTVGDILRYLDEHKNFDGVRGFGAGCATELRKLLFDMYGLILIEEGDKHEQHTRRPDHRLHDEDGLSALVRR